MLLRLHIEPQFPLQPPRGVKVGTPLPGAAGVVVMWLVQDSLPLQHPRNVAALLQGLKLKGGPAAAPPGLFGPGSPLVGPNGALDAARSPRELGLPAGVLLSTAPPGSAGAAEVEAARARNGTIAGAVALDAGSAPGSPRSEAGDDDGERREEEDEAYVAVECGWFPFTLGAAAAGEALAEVIDPCVEPQEADALPLTQQLCGACTSAVLRGRGLNAKVDRHYKPMMLDTDVLGGWLEKLGQGPLARWQRRWFIASEKDLDWYERPPTSIDKKKIRNTRPVSKQGQCCIAAVIANPDPAEFPKCKDTLYHYFGIKWTTDGRTVLYRSGNADEVAKFVEFFQRMKRRFDSQAAPRNPVFWKRTVDGVLVRSSDVGEYSHAMAAERETCAALVEVLRADCEALLGERPRKEADVALQLEGVRALQRQLAQLETAAAAENRAAEAAEGRLEVARLRLAGLEDCVRDEARHHEYLRDRAAEQRAEAAARARALEAEVEAVQREERDVFARWRKWEEQADRRKRVPGSPWEAVDADLLSFSAGHRGTRQHVPTEAVMAVLGSPAPTAASTAFGATAAAPLAALQLCGGSPFCAEAAGRSPSGPMLLMPALEGDAAEGETPARADPAGWSSIGHEGLSPFDPVTGRGILAPLSASCGHPAAAGGASPAPVAPSPSTPLRPGQRPLLPSAVSMMRGHRACAAAAAASRAQASMEAARRKRREAAAVAIAARKRAGEEADGAAVAAMVETVLREQAQAKLAAEAAAHPHRKKHAAEGEGDAAEGDAAKAGEVAAAAS